MKPDNTKRLTLSILGIDPKDWKDFGVKDKILKPKGGE